MTKADIVSWLSTEFQPLTLATPTTTIEQLVDNTFRYWNTHSAYKIVQMVTAPGENGRVQLQKEIKSVVSVIPDRVTTWIFRDHPLWTLLGITILDNVTSDLILLGEAYRAYRNYIGAQMRWKFEKSDDPSVGGYLYSAGIPKEATRVYVVGTRRIYTDEDIVSEHVLNWVLYYAKALLKQVEGNTLRKSDIIGVKNDGQQLYEEGQSEMKDLQEQLRLDGRWVAFIRRF
jgi:hypothetical protein